MFIVLAAEVAIAVFLFNYTQIGKYAKMLGANKIAAGQSGVSLIKFRVLCYMIQGSALWLHLCSRWDTQDLHQILRELALR